MRNPSFQKSRTHADSFTPVQIDMIVRSVNATMRMSRIIDNLRLFARQSNFKLTSIPAIAPLNDALELVSEQFKLHEIEIEKDVGEDLPQVMAESIRLQQVFLNLLSNARHALDNVDAGEVKRILLIVKADDSHVEYVVEDNGHGVPDELIEKIFEPFFTTKPPGDGMGLGLSLSYGIVKDHGGQLTYERASGGGARFIIRVPIASSKIKSVVITRIPPGPTG